MLVCSDLQGHFECTSVLQSILSQFLINTKLMITPLSFSVSTSIGVKPMLPLI